MKDSMTPLIMLAIFLVGTLWLGMKYKKGSRNITEYTIGNKMFTTAALVATVLATGWGGGGLIRTVEMVHESGLWFIMYVIGVSIVGYLTLMIVSYRIGIFMGDKAMAKNHISMADTLGQIYGKIPRIITALASVAGSIVSVALQITVTSRILKMCISDMNPTILIIISASIVVLYSLFGGIQSVTVTDILQCATFTIVIPYIVYKVFHHTGMTIPQIFKALSQSEKFQFRPILQNKMQLLSLIALLMTGVSISSTSVQRMYMAKIANRLAKRILYQPLSVSLFY